MSYPFRRSRSKSVSIRRRGAAAPGFAAIEHLEDRTLLTAYVVDTLDDAVAADGRVSLREAVQAANTNAAVNEAAAGQAGAADVVTFDASLAGGTITLAGTRLDVTGALRIEGPGAGRLTISGNNLVQILAVSAGASLDVSGLTLTKGFGASAIPTRDGGAVYNKGTLSLTDVVLSGNTASFRGAALYNEGTATITGGAVRGATGTEAVYNYSAAGSMPGRLTVTGTTFSGNLAGAIYNWATLSVADSVFEDNTASSGAAIQTFGQGTVTTVTRSTFRNNVATLTGGAIDNFARMTVTDSTFVGNTAHSTGGAIENFSSELDVSGSTFSGNSVEVFHGGAIYNSSGTVRVSNSTISGNEAGWYGGGVYTFSGAVTLRNVTVFGNRVNRDGTGFQNGAGIYLTGSPTASLFNTIVLGNLMGPGAGVAEDVYGTLSGASRNNLIGGDWATVLDPVLRDNGGPTLTHALRLGSAAIDAGSDADALDPLGNPLLTDQRGAGFTRAFQGRVDIGAFELIESPPAARDDLFAADEDAPLSGNLLADNGSGADSDPDGDPLTVTAVNGSAASVGKAVTLASGAKLTVNADGSVSLDPRGAYDGLAAGQSATVTFTYTVTDRYGATSTATATVVIDGRNDAPAARNDAVAAGEDGAASGNVLANDADPDAAGLTVTAVNGDAAGVGVPVTLASGAKVTVNADGTFSFDPAGAFEGLAPGESVAVTFTYTVSDGVASSTATVTVTIGGANDPPAAVADSALADGTGKAAGDLLANDSDPDGDPLAVVAVNGSAANVGKTIDLGSGVKLAVTGGGTFSLDASALVPQLRAGESREVTFTYTVSDGRGGASTATAVVTVVGRNDPPAARADAVRVGEYGLAAGNVLSNDSDPDNDPLAVAAVNGEAAGVGRTFLLASGARLRVNADGTFAYDPNGAFVRLRRGETATDSFTYTVSDGNGGAATATVTVTVEGGGREAGLVGFVSGEWYVGRSTGASFDTSRWAGWSNAAWTALAQGDFDGDGRTDVLGLFGNRWYVGKSTGAAFATGLWSAWSDAAWKNVLVGDLNGDGKDDVLASAGGAWYAALSTGSGFSAAKLWAGTADAAWTQASLADVTGDGKEDLVLRLGGAWYAATSTGSAFDRAALWAGWSNAGWAAGLADFDGDGRADAWGLVGGTWYVGRSTGAGFATSLRAAWNGSGWKDAVAADFDGDGRADLAARLGGQWWVGLSNPAGGQGAAAYWGSWSDAVWKDVRAGDFDGDGRADLAARLGGRWYVARSTGGGFATGYWGAWKDADWKAVAAADAAGAAQAGSGDGALRNATPSGTAAVSQPLALRLADAVAPVPKSDDPLALFWSQSSDDDAFAGRLLAGA